MRLPGTVVVHERSILIVDCNHSWRSHPSDNTYQKSENRKSKKEHRYVASGCEDIVALLKAKDSFSEVIGKAVS